MLISKLAPIIIATIASTSSAAIVTINAGGAFQYLIDAGSALRSQMTPIYDLTIALVLAEKRPDLVTEPCGFIVGDKPRK
jgi:hypothetical protein